MQNITDLAGLMGLFGKAMMLGMVIGAVVAAFMMWHGLSMDRATGEWKWVIMKGIMWFGVPFFINVLFYMFYGQSFQYVFN
jgi:hypothetical protein